MKVIYMGTPEFAVPPLLSLIENHSVTAVVTQPDKPKGRGNKFVSPPVKETAISRGIPVMQPEKIRSKAFISTIKNFNADIFIVAAYGKILPETLLNTPKFGALNIHASLLPKYRGASPIQQAIINGDIKTGITIIQMDKGLDTGDIILKGEIPIMPCDTSGSMHDKLSILGAKLVIDALKLIESGDALPQKQDCAGAVYAPIINKHDGLINWNMGAIQIANLVRGLNPWPSAYTFTEKGDMLKIWEAEAVEYNGGIGGAAGVVLDIIQGKGISVSTGNGILIIKKLQRAGGKQMNFADFLRGYSLYAGDKFCNASK